MSGREAQLSVQHTEAVALLRGAPTLESYSDGAAADADVLSLGSRVAVKEDLGMDGAARVVIEIEAGPCVTC
jgi:2-methylcitrate dehydratase PrpD